ncbi:hypothetical protein DY000_02053931 [Brassica cretica]|uniref:Uncharacterized protein n=1 Tax=Brassica cretica TaxID=69181 RepID=A0ABQ7AF97_BRACR|nr:hypothetical protein DY000_02053931 [Brassica cretica]
MRQSNGSVERRWRLRGRSRRETDELSERRAQAQGSPPVRSSRMESLCPLDAGHGLTGEHRTKLSSVQAPNSVHIYTLSPAELVICWCDSHHSSHPLSVLLLVLTMSTVKLQTRLNL